MLGSNKRTDAVGAERWRQIEEFRIVEKLGAGGLAVVYKALDLKLRWRAGLLSALSADARL